MNKNFVFLAMLAMVLAFGLAVVGCGSDGGNDGEVLHPNGGN
jgi:hypothetical protein